MSIPHPALRATFSRWDKAARLVGMLSNPYFARRAMKARTSNSTSDGLEMKT